jgi:hypothetical protein
VIGRRARAAAVSAARAALAVSAVFAVVAVLGVTAARGAPVEAPLATAPPPAAAPSPLRIVLLAPTADDALGARIGAELTALGFTVQPAAIPPAADIDDVVHRSLAGGARAVVIADGTRTEIWIAEDRSDRVALRQELEIENIHDLESVLALRTVELMRVSLGLVSPPAAPARVAAAPAAPARAAAAPPVASASPPPPAAALSVAASDGARERFSLAVSSGGVASTGRLGAFPLVGAALVARVRGALGVELRGYAPLQDRGVTDPAGQARASVWLVGAGAVAATRPDRRLSVEAGAGLMTALLHTSGSATPPDTGQTDDVLGVAVYGRGAARIRVGARWSVRVDLLAGAAVRRPTIAVANGAALDHDITTWGTAFTAALAGADLRF